jgi:hypothetical protein
LNETAEGVPLLAMTLSGGGFIDGQERRDPELHPQVSDRQKAITLLSGSANYL